MRLTLGLVLTLLTCAASFAGPFADQTIPQKWLEPLLPEKLPDLTYPAWAKPLDRARMESFAGRYRKSLMTLLDATGADPLEVALVKGQSLCALGKLDQALATLADKSVADDTRVQILRAQVLAEAGKDTDAIALLKSVVAAHPDSIVGHYQLARIQEDIGDLKSALAGYTWFVNGEHSPFVRWQSEQERAFENAEEVVCIGRAADRWAALTSAYKDHEELHDAILNTFVRAYDVVDREYWPAHIAAAEFRLSHDDDREAEAELQQAADGNPNSLRALELLGEISISHFDFDRGDRVVNAIRAINPNSPTADLLEARNDLAQRRPADALAPLARVQSARPNDLEALGVLVATYALQLKDDRAAEILKQVDALDVDHDDATAYFEVAQQLGAMRQYPRAAAMYKIAVERAPWWTKPRNGLGLLYTQSGDEDLAQSTLDAAHTLDPFDIATTNYLRLLDDLSKFARKESPHFIVMYDASADPIIPMYFSDYLESINADVTAQYRTQPPRKTMIEVFPTHDAFSVRTTGSPWIGTVGASTGSVIALVAPRTGVATMGPFNWAQVLRHEYTHTVTLAATDNRIPHWMTEGLAVYQEHSPLQWDWIPMLYRAVTKNEMFTLDNLTWGFVRPRKPTDRQLAYAESFWICTYIEQKFGHEAILKMLEGFKAGQSQDEVFPQVLGKSTTEFTSEFLAWAREQVGQWGYDEDTSHRYSELRKKGEELIAQKKFPEAVTVWEQIVALRPVDALPHQRLAGLYLSKEVNQKEKAIAQLEALDAVELKNNLYAKRIAGIQRDIGKLDDAQKTALRAVYIDPYDLCAHELLAEIAQKNGDEKTLGRERQAIDVLQRANH